MISVAYRKTAKPLPSMECRGMEMKGNLMDTQSIRVTVDFQVSQAEYKDIRILCEMTKRESQGPLFLDALHLWKEREKGRNANFDNDYASALKIVEKRDEDGFRNALEKPTI
jgi:hypothetical protein